MNKRFKKYIQHNRLKINLFLSAFCVLFLAVVPLNLFMLYTDLQDTMNRQYSIMNARAENLQNLLIEKGPLEKIPASYLNGFGFSGEKIYVDKHNDKFVDKTFIHPSEKKHMTDVNFRIIQLSSPFLFSLLNANEDQTLQKKVEPQPLILRKSGIVVASSHYTFDVRDITYQVVVKKDITAYMLVPLNTFAINFIFMMFWLSTLGTLSILLFLRFIFRPLEEGIALTTKRIEHEHFAVKIPDPNYGNEVSRVVANFNELLNKCGELIDDNANTMQDISHEVRTHLTAIKQSIDIIKLYGVDDPNLVLSRITAIEMNITRATDIMTTILNLARLKQGNRLKSDECYSSQFLLENYLEFKMKRYPDFMLHADSKLTETSCISIDRQHFFLAMNPIMENATRYSVDSNTILITAQDGENDTVEFSITNHGRYINPADIPHIFDRYYRGTNIGNVKSGSGLGLTLTKEVMNIYSGDIRIDSNPDGKTTFTLIFPKSA